MTDQRLRLVDEPPPEYDESTVEGDLAAAAAAGGLTYDPDMADDDDRVAETHHDRRDATVVHRTKMWLAMHPEAVADDDLGADDAENESDEDVEL